MHVSKHTLLGRIINPTRSSTNHSRWYTRISLCPETPLKQPLPYFLVTLCFTRHMPVCLSLCVCAPLSHTHIHTYILGRLGLLSQIRRWQWEGAVSMPVELCEWGSDEREAHLVNWQLPSGFFIFFTMKGLNPCQLSAILTMREETVAFRQTLTMYFSLDPSLSWLPLLLHSVHRCSVDVCARQTYSGNTLMQDKM